MLFSPHFLVFAHLEMYDVEGSASNRPSHCPSRHSTDARSAAMEYQATFPRLLLIADSMFTCEIFASGATLFSKEI